MKQRFKRRLAGFLSFIIFWSVLYTPVMAETSYVYEPDPVLEAQYPNGLLGFLSTDLKTKEDAEPFKVTVVRQGGAEGEISVKLKIFDVLAAYGADYQVYVKDGFKTTILEKPLIPITTGGAIGITPPDTELGDTELGDTEIITPPESTTPPAIGVVTSAAVKPKIRRDRLATAKQQFVGNSSNPLDYIPYTDEQSQVSNEIYGELVNGVETELVFSEGERTKEITIVPIDDSVPEDPEQFMMVLYDATGGAVVEPHVMCTVEILDNEAIEPGAIGLTSGSYDVVRGNPHVTVTVERTEQIYRYATAKLYSYDLTAQAGRDYVDTPATVVFLPGQREVTVDIPLYSSDSNEILQFGIGLTDPVAAYIEGRKEAVVNIIPAHMDDMEQIGTMVHSAPQPGVEYIRPSDFHMIRIGNKGSGGIYPDDVHMQVWGANDWTTALSNKRYDFTGIERMEYSWYNTGFTTKPNRSWLFITNNVDYNGTKGAAATVSKVRQFDEVGSIDTRNITGEHYIKVAVDNSWTTKAELRLREIKLYKQYYKINVVSNLKGEVQVYSGENHGSSIKEVSKGEMTVDQEYAVRDDAVILTVNPANGYTVPEEASKAFEIRKQGTDKWETLEYVTQNAENSYQLNMTGSFLKYATDKGWIKDGELEIRPVFERKNTSFKVKTGEGGRIDGYSDDKEYNSYKEGDIVNISSVLDPGYVSSTYQITQPHQTFDKKEESFAVELKGDKTNVNASYNASDRVLTIKEVPGGGSGRIISKDSYPVITGQQVKFQTEPDSASETEWLVDGDKYISNDYTCVIEDGKLPDIQVSFQKKTGSKQWISGCIYEKDVNLTDIDKPGKLQPVSNATIIIDGKSYKTNEAGMFMTIINGKNGVKKAAEIKYAGKTYPITFVIGTPIQYVIDPQEAINFTGLSAITKGIEATDGIVYTTNDTVSFKLQASSKGVEVTKAIFRAYPKGNNQKTIWELPAIGQNGTYTLSVNAARRLVDIEKLTVELIDKNGKPLGEMNTGFEFQMPASVGTEFHGLKITPGIDGVDIPVLGSLAPALDFGICQVNTEVAPDGTISISFGFNPLFIKDLKEDGADAFDFSKSNRDQASVIQKASKTRKVGGMESARALHDARAQISQLNQGIQIEPKFELGFSLDLAPITREVNGTKTVQYIVDTLYIYVGGGVGVGQTYHMLIPVIFVPMYVYFEFDIMATTGGLALSNANIKHGINESSDSVTRRLDEQQKKVNILQQKHLAASMEKDEADMLVKQLASYEINDVLDNDWLEVEKIKAAQKQVVKEKAFTESRNILNDEGVKLQELQDDYHAMINEKVVTDLANIPYDKLQWFWKIGIDINFGGGVGVGIKGLSSGSLNVESSMGMDFVMLTERGKGTFGISSYLKLEFLMFNTSWTFAQGEWTMFEYNNMTSSRSTSANQGAQVIDYEGLKLSERVETSDEWLPNTPSTYAGLGNAKDTLLKHTGVYPDADPQIVKVSEDQVVITFLNDPGPGKRDNMNRTELYYTVVNRRGEDWVYALPKAVTQDDTPDFEPHLFKAGDHIIATWSSPANAYQATTQAAIVMNLTEIYTAFYDPATQSFGPPMAVTNDEITKEVFKDHPDWFGLEGFADSNPQVTYDEASKTLAYFYSKAEYFNTYHVTYPDGSLKSFQERPSEEEIGDGVCIELPEGDTMIAYRLYNLETNTWVTDYNGVEFEEDNNFNLEAWYGQRFLHLGLTNKPGDPDTLRNPEVTEIVATAYDGKALIAYSIDTDGEIETVTDQEMILQMYNFGNQKVSHPISLTTNEYIQDYKPQFARTDNEIYLFWVQNGILVYQEINDLLENGLEKIPSDDGREAYKLKEEWMEPLHAMQKNEYQVGNNYQVGTTNEGYIYVIWTEAVGEEGDSRERKIPEERFYATLYDPKAEATEEEDANGVPTISYKGMWSVKNEIPVDTGWGHINESHDFVIFDDGTVLMPHMRLDKERVDRYGNKIGTEEVVQGGDGYNYVRWLPDESSRKLIVTELNTIATLETGEESITFSNDAPNPGDTIQITASVTNGGFIPSGKIEFIFEELLIDGTAREIERKETGTKTLGGTNATMTIEYIVPNGLNAIRVTAYEYVERINGNNIEYEKLDQPYISEKETLKLPLYTVENVHATDKRLSWLQRSLILSKNKDFAKRMRVQGRLGNCGNAASQDAEVVIVLYNQKAMEEADGVLREDNHIVLSSKPIKLEALEERLFSSDVDITKSQLEKVGNMFDKGRIEIGIVVREKQPKTSTRSAENSGRLEVEDMKGIGSTKVTLEDYDRVDSITFEGEQEDGKVIIEEGQTQSLQPVMLPESSGEYNHLFYEALNPDIVSVAASGEITAHQKGAAKIKVTAIPYGFERELNVEVTEKMNKVESIILEGSHSGKIEITEGDEMTLKLEILPVEAAKENTLSYRSLNPEIVTISSEGRLRAHKEGTTEIKVIATPDGFVQNFTVNVHAKYVPPTEPGEDDSTSQPVDTGKQTINGKPLDIKNQDTPYVIELEDGKVALPVELLKAMGDGKKIEVELKREDNKVILSIYVDGTSFKIKDALKEPIHVSTVLKETEKDMILYNESGKPVIWSKVEDDILSFLTTHDGNFTLEPQKVNLFEDVDNYWGKSAISFLYNRGIIAGMTKTSFEPNTSITRGQFVTMIMRMLEVDDAIEDNAFEDVHTDDYYYQAVLNAHAMNIVGGVGEGKFEPNRPITREEMAIILARVTALQGLETDSEKQISDMKDLNMISDYAFSSMETVYQMGIFQGDDRMALRPKDATTRGETAQVLRQWIMLRVKEGK